MKRGMTLVAAQGVGSAGLHLIYTYGLWKKNKNKNIYVHLLTPGEVLTTNLRLNQGSLSVIMSSSSGILQTNL